MPPSAVTLSDLLAEPFGPYWDSQILTDACKNTTQRNVVALTNLKLELDGKPTGLTECEPCQPEYDRKRFAGANVRFRGVLDIQSLAWLIPQARERLEKDLRKRDVRARNITSGRSRLTLEGLYGTAPGTRATGRKKIKVEIQGYKMMTAVFLTSRDVPDGLLLCSKDRSRRYEVLSMDYVTYSLSRKYLSRYRTLRVLQDLLALEGNATSHRLSTTPIHERTPRWFAELYLTHMARDPDARKRRIVYTDSDSDIESGSGGRLKEGREHVLRHVPHAEVLSLFAKHAEWILQQQLNMQNKWLDVDVWLDWVREVRRMRKESAKADISWGVYDDTEKLFGEGGSESEEDDIPVIPRRKGKGKRKEILKSRGRPRKGTILSRSGSRSPFVAEDPVDESTLRSYDLDFSPPSTPPGSPSSSSDSLPSRPSTPTDPALWALIPSAFMREPSLSASYEWVCPVRGCFYTINLLTLTDENCAAKGLLPAAVQRLKAGKWHLNEPLVHQCFGLMVSQHYEDHIEREGIMLQQVGKEWKLMWKHPQCHPSWPPHRKPDAPAAIKREDE